jgi:hypothetical protein
MPRRCWGRQSRLSTSCGDEGRSRVARLRVNDTTVVAKRSVGWDDKPFAYRDDADEAPFRHFCNEVAGCEVLGRLGFGPRLMANAPERAFS